MGLHQSSVYPRGEGPHFHVGQNGLVKHRVSHKGDISSLYSINNDQFLLSFSMDGTMHLNQLGSLQAEAKMDGNLALVRV